MNREFGLEGRVAIVTGASRGIGRATALALAEAGAKVLIAARSAGPLEELAREVRECGGVASAYVCDVSDFNQVEAMVDRTVREFGELDIMVANAGTPPAGWVAKEISAAEAGAELERNLHGAIHSCLAAGRAMVDGGGGGSLVTVASLEGHIALSGDLPYVVAKHGVVGLTRALAVEWARYEIRVNAVSPGFVASDQQPDEIDAEILSMRDRIPLRRSGRTREVALAIVFLASPAASYVTGATVPVDGGWLAG